MSQPESPIYSPLNKDRLEIRLFHLAPLVRTPGEEEEPDAQEQLLSDSFDSEAPAKGHFSVVSLIDQPQFEALSYVWGDRSNQVPIKVEGTEVLVTQNLHAALKRLRDTHAPRRLWVDAICINQTDLQEQADQVAVMRDIFTAADSVTVWLGELNEDNSLVLDAIEQSRGNPDLHWDTIPGQQYFSTRGLTFRDEHFRDCLIEFFLQPWWQRVWTVQEFALAKHVTFKCGSRTFSERDLAWFIFYMSSHVGDRPCCQKLAGIAQNENTRSGKSVWSATNVVSNLNNIRQKWESTDFLLILANCRSRQSTDPRDKIFGMLGLASGALKDLVTPNYKATVESVFAEAAVKTIERTRSWNILSHVSGRKSLRLPSFTPDWTVTPFFNNGGAAMERRIKHLELFSASAGGVASINCIAPGKISTQGYTFDRISRLGPRSQDFYKAHFLPALYSCAGFDETDDLLYCHTAIQRRIALVETLCGGTLPSHEDKGKWRVYDPVHDAWCYNNWKRWAALQDMAMNLSNEVHLFHAAFRAISLRRGFASTEKGYIGWVPLEARIGDAVVILPGGRVPYILRPVNDPQLDSMHRGESIQYYQILGDAYIHGVMDGEIFSIFKVMGGELDVIGLI